MAAKVSPSQRVLIALACFLLAAYLVGLLVFIWRT